MQVSKEQLSPTKIKLTLIADAELLRTVKEQTLRAVGRDMKLPGFRAGKIPLPVIEKNANPALLQQEFVERAMNSMYGTALESEKLRPVAQPQADVKKFVPYDTLEMEAEVEVIGNIKLPDYKAMKLKREDAAVTDEDVEEVLKQLRLREAEKKDVDRASKDGDQVWIDFAGVDHKTGEPVKGADGKQYPLVLGSNTFIPGFEPQLVGMKADEEKIFPVTFPDDYGVSALQGQKVEFTVKVTKVQEVVEPVLDDSFAEKIGPFKDVEQLKSDIRKQVAVEKQNRIEREYENKLLQQIADKSEAEIPESLISDEIDRLEQDERQNLVYRGQTWQEHLDAEGVTAEQHREQKREEASRRVKAGLVISEIAVVEGVDITRDELEMRLMSLKSQYQDKAMQAELDKPENRREIASRLLTEKTIQVLVGYATAK